MKVLAITTTGREFLYRASTAHSVSKSSAERICSTLNAVGYKTGSNEAWHIYDIDEYDIAYIYAVGQSFKIRNRKLVECR